MREIYQKHIETKTIITLFYCFKSEVFASIVLHIRSQIQNSGLFNKHILYSKMAYFQCTWPVFVIHCCISFLSLHYSHRSIFLVIIHFRSQIKVTYTLSRTSVDIPKTSCNHTVWKNGPSGQVIKVVDFWPPRWVWVLVSRHQLETEDFTSQFIIYWPQ